MLELPKNYKCLTRQSYSKGIYEIVPIRVKDRFSIMKWRNEQIYHLRQINLLTKEDQDKYFKEIVFNLFTHKNPDQILFSYLEDKKCIGYGGLVHINWIDMNAELSFVMDTSLEKDHFEVHWRNYLGLIEEVAFEELRLHKIYTYAFDLRPRLYSALSKSGFELEARLKQHILFGEKFIDVVIHSKLIKST